jgi:hypothetical protein
MSDHIYAKIPFEGLKTALPIVSIALSIIFVLFYITIFRKDVLGFYEGIQKYDGEPTKGENPGAIERRWFGKSY